MTRQLLAGVRVLLILTLVLGIIYPLAVTGIAQVSFSEKANGSLVQRGGSLVGSRLIGQNFSGPRWFHPRPSAAGDGYDALASAASNLGPENAELLAAIRQRRAAVAKENGVDPSEVPPDALTASGSGLDPHISPEYARLQANRVARARGLDPGRVRRLVDEHVEGRTFGFLGERRVNVLELNLAVDGLAR
jgi:K+-transporting ATPase ATPase C chain